MTQLRLKKARLIKLIIVAAVTFYTFSFLIGNNSDPETDNQIPDNKIKGLDVPQQIQDQRNFGALPENDNQPLYSKLGISERIYLFRKERFDKYQSTMFQVRLYIL